MERRTALVLLVQAGSAMVASIVGIPALLAALAPGLRKRRGQAWRPLGMLDDFAVGKVQEGLFEREPDGPVASDSLAHQAVYVWRRSPEEVIVFSRSCTDLGCPVTWDPGSGCFLCPCHGGIFSNNGDRMAGPPDRPLYRYANRVRDGVLEIDLYSVPPMV